MKFSQTFGQALENRPVFYRLTLEGIAAVDRAGLGALRSQPSMAGRQILHNAPSPWRQSYSQPAQPLSKARLESLPAPLMNNFGNGISGGVPSAGKNPLTMRTWSLQTSRSSLEAAQAGQQKLGVRLCVLEIVCQNLHGFRGGKF